ncbi:transglutaminase domain-containing protein [Butyrivibrio sp. MB2005]|uniref:transglutaminase domain-containing protein n=1 Tax=Butyrivibrio sp. MB2005 TaxID=1280678 RepID=UPI00040F549C|nr:transglutaminase domain-containing protein [Butyrivibrio sp. MB2005]
MKTKSIRIISSLVIVISLAILIICNKDYTYDNDNLRVFYNALNDDEKEIYEMFHDLVIHKNEKNYQRVLTLPLTTYYEKGASYYWNIYYAMCYDHPEYFFLLTGSEPRITSSKEKADKTVTITYYLRKAPAGEDSMIAEFEEAADNFLKDIDLSAPKKEIELEIHDKLIDLVTYDYELNSLDAAEKAGALGSTAYGALVRGDDGTSNHAICGGYALAFEYLCQRAGIPCGYVTGIANPDADDPESSGFHAWNIVYIDNNWYEVDTTWDDFDMDYKIESPDLRSKMLADDNTMYALRHHFYNINPAEMRNLPESDDTVFTIPVDVKVNPRHDSYHLRGTYELDKTDNISMFLNSLLP